MSKKVLYCFTTILIIAIIGVAIYNITTCDSFWNANFYQCASLFIIVGISYFVVQRQTDYRKQKDIFIKLVNSLKDIVDDKNSYVISGVSKEEILMRLRDIGNKVDIISNYGKRFNIQKDIELLNKLYKEYECVIDDHITDLDTLSKLHNELKRPLKLISQKAFEIMLNLYN